MAITPPSAITVAITPLPQPPQTSDPANFDVRADAFVLAEQVFSQQVELARQQVSANALVSQNNAQESANSAAASAAQVSLAAAQVGLAADQVALAQGKVTLATAQADRATEKAGAAADTLALIQNIASGLSFTSTSTTSNSISAGTKTFTVDAGESFVAGMPIYAVVTNDPTRYLIGVCTSYSGTTLVVAVSQISANTGTFSAWNISIGGIPGTAGQGVPNGGAIDQILRKKSAADYDAEWSTLLIGDIGDVAYSYATNKGAKWKKADGSIISRASYPDFAALNGSPVNKLTNASTEYVVTAQTQPGGWNYSLNAVCKVGSLYIVGGTRGLIFTSPDLTTWTQRSTDQGGSYDIAFLVYDGTYVVAISSTGYTMRSADGGLSWTSLGYVASAVSFGGLFAVASNGAGTLMAMATYSNMDGEGNPVYYAFVIRSTNGGATWSNAQQIVSSAAAYVSAWMLTWTGSRFIAAVVCGNVAGYQWISFFNSSGTLTGGRALSSLPGTNQIYWVGSLNERIFVGRVSALTAYYSDDDCVTWSPTALNANISGQLVSLAGNGILVGNNGGTAVVNVDQVITIGSSLNFGIRSTGQIDNENGYILIPGTVASSNVRVSVLKPFTYDVKTQTALPKLAPSATSNAQLDKAANPFVKVL